MKKLLICIIFFGLFSCQKNEKSNTQKEDCSTETEGKKFEMYQMSEMAALMEQMYVDNERLKARIIKGDTIGKFPNHFLKIHQLLHSLLMLVTIKKNYQLILILQGGFHRRKRRGVKELFIPPPPQTLKLLIVPQ